ncbi:MAG: hypothetical protein ACPGSD_00140 [Flavobacteriales bacterium]
MSTTGLTYNMLEYYFRNLSQKHSLINSFSGFTDAEFDYVVSKKHTNKYPMMALSDYSFKLTGNKQRAFSERVIEFSIGVKLKDRSVESVKAAEALAEEIGLQIISRIKQDSEICKDINWLYENFDVNTVKAQALDKNTKDGIRGMSFSFELRHRQPLIVNNDIWEDKK